MGKIRQKAIGTGLKAVANNPTANNIANEQLRKKAEASDNKILKFVANNKIANTVANKGLKIIANNDTLNEVASRIIDENLQ